MSEGWDNLNHNAPYPSSEWEEIKPWILHSHSRFYRRITGLRVFDSRSTAHHKSGWFARLTEWWFTP